jgi:integrase
MAERVELMHAEFSDLNWGEQTFRVQGKPHWNSHVKTHGQREIPIPDDVLKELRRWKKKSGDHLLILATRGSRAKFQTPSRPERSGA